jgi:2'-5' RNA ligase
LPEEVRDRLAEWQQLHLTGVRETRLVPSEHLHITLAFLGSTAALHVPDVVAALRESCRDVGRPVVAPSRYRETRSVGMLVLDDEEGRCAALAAALQERLEGLGVYRREKRAWLPHITVLRFRQPPRLSPPLPELGPVGLSDAGLYHSVLRSTGAQYEILEMVALGG